MTNHIGGTRGGNPVGASERRAIVEQIRRRAMRARERAEPKPSARGVWALGDYHKVSKDVNWGVGQVLVEACGITEGQRVLDVAAGTGNVAIRAAQAGARVVASDITPELFKAGRREAAARGVEVKWVEADAQALPFGDGEFDVVTSSIGAMFAPDHQAAANELIRVCRPGGTIGMVNWTPDGSVGEFFKVFAPHAPPPAPGALPPILWGSERHVRELFGDRVSTLELIRRRPVDANHPDPVEFCAYFKRHFGPTIAAFAAAARDPERLAALDRDFLDHATRANRGGRDGPAVYELEYLLVVARKAPAAQS